MESFLANLTPEIRRVVSRITGNQSLKKTIEEILEKKKNQTSYDGGWGTVSTPISAFNKKITLRKNVQNKI